MYIQNKTFSDKYQTVFFIAVILVLSISTLSVYWQTRSFDYINYDDDVYVYENHHIQNGINIKSIKWAFTSAHASNWHPLTWISHMIDIHIYGMDSGKHHVTNVSIHILSTIILFCAFRMMTGNFFASFLISFLFALHPTHIQSVVWISERKDVLSGFFFMLSLYIYGMYAKSPSLKRYLIVFFVFFMGLLSKPMLVTLPFVLLLLDYWPLKRFNVYPFTSKPFFKLIQEKIPFFSLC